MPIIEYSREFMVLADCMSFSVAARRLNVSQPTLSRHIAELEADLGFQLLRRNPLGFTEAGRRYLEAISSVVAQLDEAVRVGRSIQQGQDQAITVFMLPSRSDYARIVYESATKMRGKYPSFALRAEYDNPQLSMTEAVETGVAQLAVLSCPPNSIPMGFRCVELVDLPVCAWVRRENPAASIERPHLADLAQSYLVRSTNRQSQMWHDTMTMLLRRQGLEPKTHLKNLDDLPSFYMNLEPDEVLFDADMESNVNEYNPQLVKVRFDDPPLLNTMYLYYNDTAATPLLKEFVAACLSAAN